LLQDITTVRKSRIKNDIDFFIIKL
jgi:hypothetical protein